MPKTHVVLCSCLFARQQWSMKTITNKLITQTLAIYKGNYMKTELTEQSERIPAKHRSLRITNVNNKEGGTREARR